MPKRSLFQRIFRRRPKPKPSLWHRVMAVHIANTSEVK